MVVTQPSRPPEGEALGFGDPRRPGRGTSAFVSRALGDSQGWGDAHASSSAFRHAGHAENLPSPGYTSLSQVRYSVPRNRVARPFHGTGTGLSPHLGLCRCHLLRATPLPYPPPIILFKTGPFHF